GDPPAAAERSARHPRDDGVLLQRDAKGPRTEVEGTVKSGGEVLGKERTDSQGELLLPFRKLTGKDIEISVAQDAVGDKGQLVAVLNESGAARTLLPGRAPADQ